VQGTGGNDVTIFVAAGDARPYLLEAAEDDDRDDWCVIGRSSGVTQSFSLQHNSKVLNSRALRITDLKRKGAQCRRVGRGPSGRLHPGRRGPQTDQSPHGNLRRDRKRF
jgi:hypothetical protein